VRRPLRSSSCFAPPMRLALLVGCLAASAAHAQGRDTVQYRDSIAYEDATAIAYLYNLPAALRASSGVTIATGQTVDGNVAVLEATLAVAGHVTGRVVVINGDLTLRPGARIDGDVVITGGDVSGIDSAVVGGSVTVYHPTLLYRTDEEGHVIAVRDESRKVASWFRRWLRRHQRSQSRLMLKGGTYNRVEGLPLLAGVTLRRNSTRGPFRLEALGIYRSADGFEWQGANLGYTARTEMQFGHRAGVALGLEAFDVVQPVEDWQLRDSEIALAAFFLRRDYRDYYNRKGGRGYVALRDGRAVDLTLSYGEERWEPREARDPFTLLRNSRPWRANPVLDDGRFRLADATLTFDTRNDPADPWTGWFVTASVEHGWSGAARLGPTAPLARDSASAPVRIHYTRGFLDARRYNRLSPQSQLNLRLVLAGWLGGEALPLERRLSLGGAGSLPGYDFREITPGADVLTCSDGVALDGQPAQCERMALAQVEYRGALPFRLFGGANSQGGGWSWSFYHPVQWVVFADAGRGWLLHERVNGSVHRTSAIPALDTFKSDLGVGLDAEVLGVFVAKSLTDWGHAVNVFVRLRHRF
jgi:hypothetical protein